MKESRKENKRWREDEKRLKLNEPLKQPTNKTSFCAVNGLLSMLAPFKIREKDES